jgi:peptide/nickel transport system substrate-binding protein
VAPATPVLLRVGTGTPRTGNPNSGVSALIDSLALEAPLATDWYGRPSARAITDWQWVEDGLGLRLHLQPGLTFHDGTPLTNRLAAQIIDARLRIENSGTVPSSSILSVLPEGSTDIVIRTSRPEGFLLSDLSLLNFSLPDHPRVGTGPFQLVSGEPEVKMRAFAGYRGGEAKIGEIEISRFDSQRAAWAAMMRGEINLLYDVSGDAVEFVQAESTVHTFSFARAYYHALVFNNSRPPFTDRQVRRALNLAVDRQQIVQTALKGLGQPTDNPIWPYHWAYPTDLPSYSYDREGARRLLDERGLVGGRTRGTGGMPARMTFTCLLPEHDQRLEAIARVLQKQLFSLGVDMNVVPLPMQALGARAMRQDYDALLIEFGSLRSLAFLYGTFHSPLPEIPGRLPMGYSGADAALDALRAALSDDETRTAVRALRQALHDDPPAVFLDWSQGVRALDTQFAPPEEFNRDIWGSIQKWQPVASRVVSR